MACAIHKRRKRRQIYIVKMAPQVYCDMVTKRKNKSVNVTVLLFFYIGDVVIPFSLGNMQASKAIRLFSKFPVTKVRVYHVSIKSILYRKLK